MQSDQDVINQWSGAATYWEKHRVVIREMFAPVTQGLIDDALVGGGRTVLDIAMGPGEPALSIASVVGTNGKVFGIDPIPGMVAAARRAAESLGVTNAEFEVAFADHLPFANDTFDAVVSRFGVMFFPSPVDGVREMLRVLKPGGKLALAAWDFADRNPFFSTIHRVMQRYADTPPPAPDTPEPFRFASPGKLRDVLGEAGAAAPSERLLQFTIRAPISAEEFWTVRSEMSEKLREKLAKFPEELLNEVKCQAIEAFREYSTDEGMSFPAQVLIVSGSKS